MSDLGRRVDQAKQCETCGADFYPFVVNKTQRFCCWACYVAAPSAVKVDQRGEKNPNWKGGVAKDHYRYKRRFAAKNPEKVRAHNLVAYAKAVGKLVPQPCEECGAAQAHAHHEDYSKPLEVRWVCQLCHNRHHHLGVERGAQQPSRRAPSEPFLWRGVWRGP